MFSSYPHETATSQYRARVPPFQNTTYPISNTYVHGNPIQPMEEATQEYYVLRHHLAGLKQDHLVDPHYQNTSLPPEFHTTFLGHYQQPGTAGSNEAYMENPNYHAVSRNAASEPDPYQPREFKRPEVPTDLIPPTDLVRSNTTSPIEACLQDMLYFDEVWAKITRNRVEIGSPPQEELQGASYHKAQKRLRTPEPALGVGASQWMGESQDWGGEDPPNTRPTIRRRVTMDGRKTEDRVTARRDETQVLRARRTSGRTMDKSKLGNRGLRKETLAAPPQGVYPSFSPRPNTGTTLGPTEYKDQAWTWMEGSEHTSGGTEDVHDNETDGERWYHLMVLEEDEWKCRECPGQPFFDRSTLRRHCKTVHGSDCDRWKCPQCPDKSYSRKSGFNRHMKNKHQGGV